MHHLSDAELSEAMTAALRGDQPDEFERLAAESDRRDAERETRLSATEALARAAHWYASNGVAVFLIQPRDKKPFAGSRGFKDATTDLTVVASWWQRSPDANVGLPTGLRFDVIDVDGPDGYQSLATLKEASALPPLLGTVYTPRGGRHLYVAPTGRGNSAGLAPGIDYRGLGGYVVAPPSVGATGKRYDWLQPLNPTASKAGAA